MKKPKELAFWETKNGSELLAVAVGFRIRERFKRKTKGLLSTFTIVNLKVELNTKCFLSRKLAFEV